MVSVCVLLHDQIFPSITKACGIMGWSDVGSSVYSLVTNIGFDVDVFVGSSLVDICAKYGEMNSARKMFDEMLEKTGILLLQLLTLW